MKTAETTIRAQLLALQDEEYRAFQCKLMPTVPPEKVIGVRTPALRRLAKSLAGTPEAAQFLVSLPHETYDENNLHAFLLEPIRDFDAAVAAVDAFLPWVDNWATCDQMNPKAFAKNHARLLPVARGWMASAHTYTVRYGVGVLMRYFLDGDFKLEYLALAAGVVSQEYYVNMMLAWYFATALAKQWDATLPFFTEKRLAPWVHNKAIQKAVESYRVPQERKELLRTLRLR